MERRGLQWLLLIASSTAGADFEPELCACLSEEGAASLLGEGVDVASYPAGYGIGCTAHDRNREECRPRSRSCPMPGFCTAEWCWVDPENCSLSHQPSISFPGLTKSYAACGHAVPVPATFRSVLERPLKICPKNNTGGYLGCYFNRTVHSMDDLTGAVAALMAEALKRYDLPNPRIISPEEFLTHCKNKSHNGRDLGADDREFDCCIFLTSLGVCDVCLTEATKNEFRSELVAFVQTSDEARQLVSFVEERGSNWFLALWGPFSPTAWLITILVPVPALVFVVVAHCRASRRTGHSRGPKLLCCKGTNVEDADQDWPSCVCWLHCYKSRNPARCGGCMTFGLRVYFEVTLLLYSSVNFVHHYSMKQIDFTVETLHQVKSGGHIVGLQLTDADAFNKIHNPEFERREIERRVDLLNFMENGDIHAAITTPQDLEVEHMKGNHCNKQMVGGALQTVPMGIAISHMVARELEPKLQKLRDDGIWDSIVKARKPKSSCDRATAAAPDTLSWKSVVLLQGLVFTIIFLGCSIDTCLRCRALSKRASGGPGDCGGVHTPAPGRVVDLEDPQKTREVRIPIVLRRNNTCPGGLNLLDLPKAISPPPIIHQDPPAAVLPPGSRKPENRYSL